MKTKKTVKAKKKTLWFGQIPGIFGYGISALSESKEGVMKALRDRHAEWVKTAGSPYDHVNDFKGCFEYFGGSAYKVELDRAYDENLRD